MKERLCCGQTLKSNKKIVPSVSAPLHLILRAPSPASHEWKSVPAVKRLCQVCHLVVDGKGVRCRACGLRAHSACGSSYSDNNDSNLRIRTSGKKEAINFHQDRQGSLFYRHFEPRIKKILHQPHHLLPSIESGGEERGSGASSSARFSSCGDSVAASTAIVVGTVSIETNRSESKTPEITITPGSEVAAVETGTEIEARLLSSSASELPEIQHDSGCAGLLDEEEEEEDSREGESNLPENHSVGLGHKITATSTPRKTGRGSTSPGSGQVVPSRSQKKRLLLYVDGPIDGSPYALVKQKPFTDSGFGGVDQMKDLDKLISALVQEAESIDSPNNAHRHQHQNHPANSTSTTGSNIPYHAREDSLPFSYTSPQSITSQTGKRHHHTHTHQSQQEPHQHPSSYSTTIAGGPINHYSVSSPSYTTPTSNDHYSTGGSRGRNIVHQHRDTNTSENSQLSTGLSRSITQPSYSNYGRNQQATSSNQMVGSLSSNSFNYGGTVGNGNGVRRNRSQSADGRRDHYEGRGDVENADEWLARQQQKLREKKASKHPVVRNDWLAELKRALPQAQQIERSQSQTDYSQQIIHEIRPSQISRVETTPLSHTPISQISRVETTPLSHTPISTSSSTPRGNVIAYSSDDDEDDVEIDIFSGQRGKKIQRHYSESTYDRGGYTSSSSRAPSQQSYTETPFPICPPTPYTYTSRPITPPGKPPRSPKAIRRYQGGSSAPISPLSLDMVTTSSRMERAQTPVNPRPIFMVDSEVKFAQDLSEFWYKPFAAREETVATLMQSPTGSFIIRNSNSFPGAYGLAVKTENGECRHFLIEPTRFGCRLRGCGTLEPVFGSLSALVYAHSIECLALPTTLTLPSYDILPSSQSQSTTAHLLRQGAACQLLFLGMVGVECLSGEEAISKGVGEISAASPVPISLRLSKSGLTLTDVFRKQFFRIHFALNEILYASVVGGRSVAYGKEVKQVFGIVARAPRASENSVILLAEFEPGQPANAIVSFIQRVLAWQH